MARLWVLWPWRTSRESLGFAPRRSPVTGHRSPNGQASLSGSPLLLLREGLRRTTGRDSAPEEERTDGDGAAEGDRQPAGGVRKGRRGGTSAIPPVDVTWVEQNVGPIQTKCESFPTNRANSCRQGSSSACIVAAQTFASRLVSSGSRAGAGFTRLRSEVTRARTQRWAKSRERGGEAGVDIPTLATAKSSVKRTTTAASKSHSRKTDDWSSLVPPPRS